MTITLNPKRYWRPNRGQGLAAAFLRENLSYAGDDCLRWPFSKNPNGYGMMGFEGKLHWAHRFMCELVNGPPASPDLEAAHSCGEGKNGCVDPRHLSWKTISGNSLDCRAHGTQVRNHRGNRGHLTDAEVAEIKGLQGYLTQVEIAAMFNTSPPTVRDIFTGRSRANRTLRKPLTDAEVLEVRTGTETPTSLAKRLKTTQATIWRIRNGISYKDVTNAVGQELKVK